MAKLNSLLSVYFDGLCPLCSREIRYYRTKSGAEKIDWVDITLPGFNAPAEGLDPDEVHRSFHVKKRSGEIVAGVDAFVEIWKIIPSLENFLKLSRLPGALPVMKLGYAVFAKIRPLLPRASRLNDECGSDACELPSRRGASRD